MGVTAMPGGAGGSIQEMIQRLRSTNQQFGRQPGAAPPDPAALYQFAQANLPKRFQNRGADGSMQYAEFLKNNPNSQGAQAFNAANGGGGGLQGQGEELGGAVGRVARTMEGRSGGEMEAQFEPQQAGGPQMTSFPMAGSTPSQGRPRAPRPGMAGAGAPLGAAVQDVAAGGGPMNAKPMPGGFGGAPPAADPAIQQGVQAAAGQAQQPMNAKPLFQPAAGAVPANPRAVALAQRKAGARNAAMVGAALAR